MSSVANTLLESRPSPPWTRPGYALSSSQWSLHIRKIPIKKTCNQCPQSQTLSWSLDPLHETLACAEAYRHVSSFQTLFGISSWIYPDTVLENVPRSLTLSWRFFRRRHSPGVFSWIYLDTVLASVPRSQTLSWRVFRRRRSPGDSPWVHLDTVLANVPRSQTLS